MEKLKGEARTEEKTRRANRKLQSLLPQVPLKIVPIAVGENVKIKGQTSVGQ